MAILIIAFILFVALSVISVREGEKIKDRRFEAEERRKDNEVKNFNSQL